MTNTIGMRIKEAREAIGLSTEDLASELYMQGCKVTRQTLLNYEKGRTEPKPSIMVAVARVVKKPIGYFFDSKLNQTGKA